MYEVSDRIWGEWEEIPNAPVRIATNKTCVHCGQQAILELPEDQAHKVIAWAANGGPGFIQDELKFLNSSQREMLITGTHAKCWDEMFPEEEE